MGFFFLIVLMFKEHVLVSAGRWWKKSSNQILDDSRTKHVVPKLSRRVFSVFFEINE